MTKLPSFIDFEASSLSSNSYPIEVAWSLANGSIECYLISPASIGTWTDWSNLSEQVHGISRDKLLTHGKSPEWVCDRMRRQLVNQTVYTDNPAYDGKWLNELFSVVKGGRFNIKLGLVDELLFGRVYPNPTSRAAAMARIKEMKKEARRRAGGQHRAETDVKYLVELYRIATNDE